MPRQADSLTYLKLIGTMFMWGGTWIAGRVVAQELTAPLAVVKDGHGGLLGFSS